MASSVLSKLSNSSTLSFSSSLGAPIPWPTRHSARPPRRQALAVRAKIREIFMPALSSTMTEGKIVSWIRAEGDVLSKGESVVVVESDKADMDVETFHDGILAAIVVPEGETAPVGAPIGLLAESEEEIAEAKAKAAAAASSSKDPAASASPPPPPPPTAAPAASAPPPAAAPGAAAPAPEGPRKTVATPYARKLAKQHKVEIGSLIGTGPYGRITAADVEVAAGIKPPAGSNNAVSVPRAAPAAAAAPSAAKAAAAAAAAAPAPLPHIPGSTVVPFTTMQAAVSKNMMESLSVPTFRVGYPITTDALDTLYERVFIFPFHLLAISVLSAIRFLYWASKIVYAIFLTSEWHVNVPLSVSTVNSIS